MGPSTALRVSVLVLYSLIFVGSLIGNPLVLYIIAKKANTRTITSFLFINMAVADLIISIIVAPYSVAFYFRDYQWVEGIEGEVLCRLPNYCFTVAIAASIFTLTAMAFERFMAVVFPLRRGGCCGHKVCALVIWLCSTILMSPMLVVHTAEYGDCHMDWSLLNADPALASRLLLTLFFVVLYLLPLLHISILYAIICRKLWRRELISQESTTHARDESRSVVKLLITIVLVFALCWFPLHAYHMIAWAFPPKGLNPPLYVMFLCFWCGHANSAINPWVYIYFNKKFRSAFLAIIGRRRQFDEEVENSSHASDTKGETLV